MGLLSYLKQIEPDKKKSPFLHTLYDGFFTFAYTPNATTKPGGVHVRDGMDFEANNGDGGFGNAIVLCFWYL
jgi:Na+-transporting NADH:ubiquinone oxidoreductase subunit B